MANVEDRRGELPEYWMGDPRREAEEAWMRMLHQFNRNTPLSPLAEALGGHQIENSPVAQRWINRQMPQETQRFTPEVPLDPYKLPEKDWFGTKPQAPDLARALQALQLQMNPETKQMTGRIPTPMPGLGFEGTIGPRGGGGIDWRMLLRLQRQLP
jgi:hypothetical protein